MIFNRFTIGARRCVEAALEEARARGALQMFADALASIGVSFEEVRRRAGEAVELRSTSSKRLSFSPRAKKALEGALREALRLHDAKITGEHVLLGVLRDEHDMAVRILAGPGVSAEEVENRLDRLRQRTP